MLTQPYLNDGRIHRESVPVFPENTRLHFCSFPFSMQGEHASDSIDDARAKPRATTKVKSIPVRSTTAREFEKWVRKFHCIAHVRVIVVAFCTCALLGI